jgi:hypothetical protein
MLMVTQDPTRSRPNQNRERKLAFMMAILPSDGNSKQAFSGFTLDYTA